MFWSGGILGGAAPRVIVKPADLDGSSAYLNRGGDLTGNADSAQGIFSAWIRLDGGDASQLQIYWATGSTISIGRVAGNTFNISLQSSGGSALAFATANTYTASATWLHLLASWDCNFSAGNKLSHLYINDVSDKAAPTDGNAAFAVDYTVADHQIGTQNAGSAFFNGCLAELYFAPGQYLDFSNAANRRKFITADLRPEELGDTGANPTGTAPKVYQFRQSKAIGANAGTGGDFTAHGTFGAPTSSPAG